MEPLENWTLIHSHLSLRMIVHSARSPFRPLLSTSIHLNQLKNVFFKSHIFWLFCPVLESDAPLILHVKNVYFLFNSFAFFWGFILAKLKSSRRDVSPRGAGIQPALTGSLIKVLKVLVLVAIITNQKQDRMIETKFNCWNTTQTTNQLIHKLTYFKMLLLFSSLPILHSFFLFPQPIPTQPKALRKSKLAKARRKREHTILRAARLKPQQRPPLKPPAQVAFLRRSLSLPRTRTPKYPSPSVVKYFIFYLFFTLSYFIH